MVEGEMVGRGVVGALLGRCVVGASVVGGVGAALGFGVGEVVGRLVVGLVVGRPVTLKQRPMGTPG